MKKAEQSVATAHNLSPGNGTCSLRHYSYIVGRGLNRDVGLKKMNIIWLLVVASVSAGCLSLSNKEGSPNRWTAGELVGNTFTLVDTTRYAQYTFHDNGDAIATIGQVDGPLAGPVMRWQITRAGALVISDGTSQTKWIKKEWDKDRVVVNTDTGAETYLRQEK